MNADKLSGWYDKLNQRVAGTKPACGAGMAGGRARSDSMSL